MSVPVVAPRPSGVPVTTVSALVIISALVVGVGLASNTVLHHLVQTLPLWAAAAAGRKPAAQWFALPCFVFWLGIMAAIWLFLLHLPSFVNGHFSPVEIAMTILVGIAALVAIPATPFRGVSPGTAAAGFLLGAVAQFAAFRLSLIPVIWNH